MNITELAKKIGLSITTVSRALGDYDDVSQKTKEKIPINRYRIDP